MAREETQVLEAFLHRSVPLTKTMGIGVHRIDPSGIELGAPLAPNRNHFGGAFGGSIANLGLTAAWLLVHWRLSDRVPAPTVVIAEQRVVFARPVLRALVARAAMPDQASWRDFEGALERRGRGRIAMAATVEGDGEVAARFEGSFVATSG
ncbi:MAG: YiiD C-terminal domain-containing protein [Halofilum sp. (in: g-proteobacteria)]